MSTPRDPSESSGTEPGDAGISPQPTPTDENVQGYMLIFCSYCMHHHSQSDPKCTNLCGHGTSYRASGSLPLY
jgi:hypothetical protein